MCQTARWVPRAKTACVRPLKLHSFPVGGIFARFFNPDFIPNGWNRSLRTYRHALMFFKKNRNQHARQHTATPNCPPFLLKDSAVKVCRMETKQYCCFKSHAFIPAMTDKIGCKNAFSCHSLKVRKYCPSNFGLIKLQQVQSQKVQVLPYKTVSHCNHKTSACWGLVASWSGKEPLKTCTSPAHSQY